MWLILRNHGASEAKQLNWEEQMVLQPPEQKGLKNQNDHLYKKRY